MASVRNLPLLGLLVSEIAFVAAALAAHFWLVQCEGSLADLPVKPGFQAFQICTPPVWLRVPLGTTALAALIATFLTWEPLVRKKWPSAGGGERILIVLAILLDLPILAVAGQAALSFVGWLAGKIM